LDQKQAKLSELKAACSGVEDTLRQLEKDAAAQADALSKRSAAIEAECEERIKDANTRALAAMTEATQAEARLRDVTQQVEDRKAQLARLVNA
jgi:chromosome segregation ATPase